MSLPDQTPERIVLPPGAKIYTAGSLTITIERPDAPAADTQQLARNVARVIQQRRPAPAAPLIDAHLSHIKTIGPVRLEPLPDGRYLLHLDETPDPPAGS